MATASAEKQRLEGKPYLKTLLNLIKLPRQEEIPITTFKTKYGYCEYVAK